MKQSSEGTTQGMLAPEEMEDGQRSAEEYARLVSLYDESMRNLTEGEIVRGRVITV